MNNNEYCSDDDSARKSCRNPTLSYELPPCSSAALVTDSSDLTDSTDSTDSTAARRIEAATARGHQTLGQRSVRF